MYSDALKISEYWPLKRKSPALLQSSIFEHTLIKPTSHCKIHSDKFWIVYCYMMYLFQIKHSGSTLFLTYYLFIWTRKTSLFLLLLFLLLTSQEKFSEHCFIISDCDTGMGQWKEEKDVELIKQTKSEWERKKIATGVCVHESLH